MAELRDRLRYDSVGPASYEGKQAYQAAILDQYKLYVVSLTLVYVILAIGLNLTLGYAGQISLCHAAFMAFGSYAVAVLGQHGVPFEVGLVIGVVIAFAWGLVIRPSR